MPAGLPGSNTLDNFGNPNLGNFVIFDALSGPKGSPLDYDGVTLSFVGDDPTYTVGPPQHISTGALSTGIGFGSPPVIGEAGVPFVAGGALLSLRGGNFTDDYQPGVDKPDGTPSPNSTIMYIGGGKSPAIQPDAVGGQDGFIAPTPYTAGFGIAGAGNGGSRDSGANTGFGIKSVTATGAVANGAAVEAGWINRSGIAMVATQSVFGSAVAPLAAPSIV